LEKQARFGERPCKAELADRDIGQMAGFEHGDADQAHNNHVHQQFLMEGGWRATMPGKTLGRLFALAGMRKWALRRKILMKVAQ